MANWVSTKNVAPRVLFVVIGMVFSLSGRFILSHVNLKQAVKERTHEQQKKECRTRFDGSNSFESI